MGAGFVGRSREMSAVREALEAGGRLLLFAGGPGLGKSRLAAEAVELATSRGTTSAWGRCRETEGAPPFWPWTQILRSLRAAVPAIFERIDAADAEPIAHVLANRGASAHAPDPFRVFDALARMMVRIASEQPLLLVLDDLHAADHGSLQILRFVTAEMDSSRLTVIGTYREEEKSDALTELVGDVVTSRAVRLFALDGLTPADVGALIASINGGAIAPEVATTVRERTDGNPFFVTELARLGLDGPVPRGVGEAIRARVRRLPAETRSVLGAASVLGRDFGGELLEAAAQVRGVSLIAALSPAAQVRLIAYNVDGAGEGDPERTGSYRFVHALVQEVLYDDLDPARRVATHARIADALDALAGDGHTAKLDELAFHASAAAIDAESRRRAARACEEAAKHAKQKLANGVAARWFERCFELDPSRRTPALLLEHAATLEGPAARRRWEEAFSDAIARGDAATAARTALGIGSVVVSAGAIDQALVLALEHAERLLPDGDPDRIRLQARRAIELYWQSDRRTALDAATDALGRAERSGDPRAIGDALHARRFVLRGPDDLEERLRIGERLLAIGVERGDDELALQARVGLVPERCQSADLVGLDGDIAAIEALERRTRRPLARWYRLLFEGLRLSLRGRYPEALAMFDETRALGRRLGSQPTEIYFAGQRAPALRDLGRAHEAIEELREVAAAYPIFVSLECEIAMLLAEIGDTAEARAMLDRISKDDFHAVPRDSLWHAAMAFVAQAAATLGMKDVAERVYDRLLPHAGRLVVQGVPIAWGSVDHFLGVAAAGAGELDRAAAHLTESVRLHAAWGAAALRVASEAELANVLHARGRADDRDRVRALEASVRVEAARLGIVRPLLHRDRPERDSRTRPASGLTQREAEILRLVAAGQANKDIAHVLRISHHTVERHIANVYAKIGVKNRAEATAYALQHGITST